jgi:uncharacterized membrane protein
MAFTNRQIQITVAIVLLCIDNLWIYSNQNLYIRNVVHTQFKQPMSFNIIPAIAAYVFMIIGYIFIVFPLTYMASKNTNKNALTIALKCGFLFGIVLYGVYNTTNLATFKHYSPYVSIVDTLWGGFLYFILSIITVYMIRAH